MRSILIAVLTLVFLAGCGVTTEDMSIDDSQVMEDDVVAGDDTQDMNDEAMGEEVGPMDYEMFWIMIADVYENEDGLKVFGPMVEMGEGEVAQWRKYSIRETEPRALEDILNQEGLVDQYYVSISNIDAVVYTVNDGFCDTTKVDLIGVGGNVVLERNCMVVDEEDLEYLNEVIAPVL